MMIEYKEKFNLSNGRVIYNPFDYQTIDKSKEETLFKFDPCLKYVLCVGRFHQTKNQISLINAIDRLPKDMQFIFLGDGSELKKCTNRCVDLELIKRVHFLGQVENPYPFYKKCDYYFSGSFSEGFPNALIEAIALGCFPIHMNSKTGPSEIMSCFYKIKPLVKTEEFELFDLGLLLKNTTPKSIAAAFDFTLRNKCILRSDSTSNLLKKLKYERISSEYLDLL